MLLYDFGGELVQAGTLSIPVPDQADLSLTFLPAPGFQVAAVMADGVSGGGHNSSILSNERAAHTVEVFEQASRTFTDISADHDRQVLFAGIISSISASSSVGGSIYPGGNLDVIGRIGPGFPLCTGPRLSSRQTPDRYRTNRYIKPLLVHKPGRTAHHPDGIRPKALRQHTFRTAYNVSFPSLFPQEARGNKEYTLLHQPVLTPKRLQVAMVFSPQWVGGG